MKPFAVIIPTLTEAAHLPATLAAARAAFGDDAEYIVSDGGSTDATVAIAHAHGVRVISGSASRGRQLQRGVLAASAEVCVLLHADTLLPAGARPAIERALADPAVVGGAFSLSFDAAGRDRLILRLHEAAINLRARVRGNATGDHALFARRSALDRCGGVPDVRLFEDVLLCRKLRQAGRFVLLPEKVVTSSRLWREVGALRGILLHWSFQLLRAAGVSPNVLARYYPVPR